MSHSLPTTDISESDKNFLKEFTIDFYQKIVDINDFNVFDNILIEWIRSIDKDAELILELMRSHEQTELFSSIIGFFYQFGVGCDVDKNKALELYLLAISNEKSLIQKFANLNLLDENDNK